MDELTTATIADVDWFNFRCMEDNTRILHVRERFPCLDQFDKLGLNSDNYIFGMELSTALYLPGIPLNHAYFDLLLRKDSEEYNKFILPDTVTSKEKMEAVKRTHPFYAGVLSFADYFPSSITTNGYRFLSIFGVLQYRHVLYTRFLYQGQTTGLAKPNRMAILASMADVIVRLANKLAEQTKEFSLSRECPVCGRWFYKSTRRAKFCSPACKQKHYRSCKQK